MFLKKEKPFAYNKKVNLLSASTPRVDDLTDTASESTWVLSLMKEPSRRTQASLTLAPAQRSTSPGLSPENSLTLLTHLKRKYG